jgi:hypothetical protein
MFSRILFIIKAWLRIIKPKISLKVCKICFYKNQGNEQVLKETYKTGKIEECPFAPKINCVEDCPFPPKKETCTDKNCILSIVAQVDIYNEPPEWCKYKVEHYLKDKN